MIKIPVLLISASIVFLLTLPLLANADPKQFDPLQPYRDEIKQAESTASQTLLKQLSISNNDNPYTAMPRTQAVTPPAPPSNSEEKAFSLPKQTQKNIPAHPNTIAPQANNPWLKPNPWEAQSKINPWANAPIPSSTPSSAQSPLTSAPPNIFAPPQPANPLNKTANQKTH